MTGSTTGRALFRLRLGIGLFVLALSVPSLLLVLKAFDQIKWEAFRQQQVAAEELASRVDDALATLVQTEDARDIEEYRFLIGADDPVNPYPRRSPLAELPENTAIAGLLGWFQVAADGRFSTPLLPEPGASPAEFGIGPAELALRQTQARRIEGILIGNRLVERNARERNQDAIAAAGAGVSVGADSMDTERQGELREESTRAAPNAQAADTQAASLASTGVSARRQSETSNRLSQAAFERLASDKVMPGPALEKRKTLGRVEELDLDTGLAERGQRKREDAPAPAISRSPDRKARLQTNAAPPSKSVQLFETAIEPYELGRLDSGHLLLFRGVWRDGERIIQGALIEQTAFLDRLVGSPFAATALARTSDLIVAYRGEVLAAFRAMTARDYRMSEPPLSGALLYRTRLREPFGGLELLFSVSRLPSPPGATVIGWMAAALGLVVLAGAGLMYRLGVSQITLVRQQQDFVSAVSHELKTPLTSIRMYAEMLRAGFATEERKATYYRFIQEESERLSHLIANVLQLARIGRDALVLEPRPVAILELMTMARERIVSPIARAGFQLDMHCDRDVFVQADPDAFVQILINLVDNALKFAAGAQPRRIVIGCEEAETDWLRVSVRDFGPGIPRGQRARIFQLFYRGTEATTRAIAGTGIGLALVQRLTLAMGGRVEVVNREPGSEFRIELPVIGAVIPSEPPSQRSSTKSSDRKRWP
ncbi:two-component sensor histidine kinase [Thiocystis minor]|uniref:sensor histidine kinase n=1 Tax=Thiocystis minor TaxID=61597 RepID=UPI001912A4C3|nr:HAMP domain-containing sensor histidine kinase [Thiocystis minor]MBK5964178.1 two-component sensor histidine kinase [Thiocystis minor]